jgi:large subunit ribosomal protein L18e
MKKDNPVLASLIEKLKKSDKPIWLKVAVELERSRRKKVEVNLSKIDRLVENNSVVLVPGKVLGSGNITKKITVAAFNFSSGAKKLLDQNGSKISTIDAIMAANPSGKEIIILK